MSDVADGPETSTTGRPSRALGSSMRDQLRHGLDDLVGAYDADVEIRDERDRAASLPRAAVERDRARLGARCRAGRERAVQRRRARRRQSPSSSTSSTPEAGEARQGRSGGDADARAPAQQRACHRRPRLGGNHHLRAVVAHALDEPLTSAGVAAALATGRRAPPQALARRHVAQRGANPREHGLTRPLTAPPLPERLQPATPGRSRERSPAGRAGRGTARHPAVADDRPLQQRAPAAARARSDSADAKTRPSRRSAAPSSPCALGGDGLGRSCTSTRRDVDLGPGRRPHRRRTATRRTAASPAGPGRRRSCGSRIAPIGPA